VRRVVGTLVFGMGWIVVVYFGILAFVLLIGFAHAETWVGVVTAVALPVGVGMVLAGNWIRGRGLISRTRRERTLRAAEASRGPFGRPRGET
jgi:hypothetical protein